jgi:hypothetical protein
MSRLSPSEELKLYRELITPEVRADILNSLLAARKQGFAEFVDMTTFIVAHTLAGNIPTHVADSVKGYLELLFTAISAQALTTTGADGNPRVTAEAVSAARELSRKRLEGRTILDMTPDGLQVRLGIEAVPKEGR